MVTTRRRCRSWQSRCLSPRRENKLTGLLTKPYCGPCCGVRSKPVFVIRRSSQARSENAEQTSSARRAPGAPAPRSGRGSNARSAAGQQKHIIIGDAAVFHGHRGCRRGVAVIDTVDNPYRCGRDRRAGRRPPASTAVGIGAAAAERRDIPGGVHAMKARCQHDAPGPQLPAQCGRRAGPAPGRCRGCRPSARPICQPHRLTARDAETAPAPVRTGCTETCFARGQQAVCLPSGACPGRSPAPRASRASVAPALRREHGDDLVPGAVGRGRCAVPREYSRRGVGRRTCRRTYNDTSQENFLPFPRCILFRPHTRCHEMSLLPTCFVVNLSKCFL